MPKKRVRQKKRKKVKKEGNLYDGDFLSDASERRLKTKPRSLSFFFLLNLTVNIKAHMGT